MSPARESRQYILDMLDATTKARAFVKGIDEQAFLNNEEKIFAVIHALERIGEAAKHVPAGVKKRYPQVPWRLIAGTRDKLIHAFLMCTLSVSGSRSETISRALNRRSGLSSLRWTDPF
jgi:uncharacterized protein with HEPN domain